MTDHHPADARAVLVTGGTGKTGRRVVARLRARDVPVRVGSRTGTPPFDWQDRATWAPALRGAAAAYINFYPDVAVPGAPETIAAFVDDALVAGVHRLVLLSGRGEREAQRAEQLLQASGADWTIVRCSWFNQNFDESVFAEPIRDGSLALPADDVGEPFVDADDIADVAVAALTDDRHVGQCYELTGPRLLRFGEAVATIARATGRDIDYTPVPIDAWVAGMADAGVPDELVALLAYLFGEVLDGRNAQLSDGVQRALGREPRDFADFARDAAATGVWHPVAMTA